MTKEAIQAYPLSWPEGWKHTPPSQRTDGRFSKGETRYSGEGLARHSWRSMKSITVNEAVQRVQIELERMGVRTGDVIISTNLPVRLDGLPRSGANLTGDCGAAVYWQIGKKPMACMAIDRYNNLADNLAAIAATLNAMRAIERHGGAAILERAFLGFKALPETASAPWRDVLQFPVNLAVTRENITTCFRELVKIHHPDAGGDSRQFRAIMAARDEAFSEATA